MKSLIVQSDLSIMLPTSAPDFETILEDIIKFSEVVQSPDSIFILKISNLSIWNAISLGMDRDSIVRTLNQYSKHPVPVAVLKELDRWYKEYGVSELKKHDEEHLVVTFKTTATKIAVEKNKEIKKIMISSTLNGFTIKNHHRGEIKHLLMKLNVSVNDKIGFTPGEPLVFSMREYNRTTGKLIEMRDYQDESAKLVFHAGCGLVVMPCGAGKTPTGLLFMLLGQTTTLIVTNSDASVRQWKQTLLDFTTLKEEDISCYSSDNKVIAPVTICTYAMLAYKSKGVFVHYEALNKHKWGSLVCDEVHLLPASLFRIVGCFQASKRLALTATFVREDGKERDIYTLIGPKRYDKPWKDLEARGYIAEVILKEIKVDLTPEDRKRYIAAETYQEKNEIAVMSQNKIEVTKLLLEKHKGDKILIIGQSTEQLLEFSKQLGIPCVYGIHSADERELYYNMMRQDEMDSLIASSIANAALDIPSINVVIQISFKGGSRNEEAQRVGRSTRPKEKKSYFYTLVSKNTVEENQNLNRQRFLTNEGYRYETEEMAIA